MLGLVLIYFLGKAFYDLAEKFQKNQWGYAILGIVVFYGFQIVIGLVAGVYMEINNPGFWDELDSGAEFALNLVGILFGGLAAFLFYNYLKKRWSAKPVQIKQSDILDDDFLDLEK
jgi:uncharacterized membrane protein YdjX (TVP38/TMEM64 family)